VLGAFFLFLLARELGLSFFAGIIAGCGFAFGGTLARSGGWPHLFQSFVWFPPVFFFALRALKAGTARTTALYAATAGAGIALAMLAGGLYSVIMQAILIAAMSLFWTMQNENRNWAKCMMVIVIAGVIAGAGGAAQLLPSMSGSGHTLRTLGSAMFPANEKIPYAYLSDGMWAHSFIGLFLAPMAFGGNLGAGEVANPYMGVIVCALAGIAVWKQWRILWVRFFAGLTLASFAYSMAGASILHGVLYAFVPRLWMAREATRGLYLADFAVAVLCAYGAEAVFSPVSENWESLRTVLKWACVVCGAFLAAAALLPNIRFYGWPSLSLELSPGISLSLVLILATSALLWRISQGTRTAGLKALFLSVLLFDLYAFDWSALNVMKEREQGSDDFYRLVSLGNAAKFLRQRPGPFRVQLLTQPIPNIGDAFGIEATWGAAATVLKDYWDYRDVDALWNIRYRIRAASANDPGAIYSDANYKVYENAGGPRAWTVHKVLVEPSEAKLAIDLRQPDFNPAGTALVLQPLKIFPNDGAADDQVTLGNYDPGAPEVRVHAASPAVLVLSEVYDPQWTVEVNGKPAAMLRVDGALRGVEVPRGTSRVEFFYRPTPAYAGMILSSATFLCLAGLWIHHRFRERSSQLSP